MNEMKTFELVKWLGDAPDPVPEDPTTHPNCYEVIRCRWENGQEIREIWRNPNAAD